jgi:hypothetical protein
VRGIIGIDIDSDPELDNRLTGVETVFLVTSCSPFSRSVTYHRQFSPAQSQNIMCVVKVAAKERLIDLKEPSCDSFEASSIRFFSSLFPLTFIHTEQPVSTSNE